VLKEVVQENMDRTSIQSGSVVSDFMSRSMSRLGSFVKETLNGSAEQRFPTVTGMSPQSHAYDPSETVIQQEAVVRADSVDSGRTVPSWLESRDENERDGPALPLKASFRDIVEENEHLRRTCRELRSVEQNNMDKMHNLVNALAESQREADRKLQDLVRALEESQRENRRLAKEAAEMRVLLCERVREPEDKPHKLKHAENDGGQICKLDPKSLLQYNGEQTMERSVVSWLGYIEGRCKFHRIARHRWVGAAISAFGPEVQLWWATLPMAEQDQFSAEHGDWEQFVEKLLLKWLPFEFIEKLERHVQKQARQGPKESVEAYTARFQAMVTHLQACYLVSKRPSVALGSWERVFVDGIQMDYARAMLRKELSMLMERDGKTFGITYHAEPSEMGKYLPQLYREALNLRQRHPQDGQTSLHFTQAQPRHEGKRSAPTQSEDMQGKEKKFDKKKVKCYNCQKFGHFRDKCPLLSRSEQPSALNQ